MLPREFPIDFLLYLNNINRQTYRDVSLKEKLRNTNDTKRRKFALEICFLINCSTLFSLRSNEVQVEEEIRG